MNRHTKILVIALTCFLAIWIPMSFKRPADIPDHKYSLTLTEKQWSSRLQFIQNANVMIRSSTYPGNQISATQDSLVQFMQEIQQQIGSQVQADTLVKPKNK